MCFLLRDFLTLPERLKDLRTERSLDIAEVAKATGLSSSALSNYENDEGKDISHRAILALAKFYGVSADYLLDLTEIKITQTQISMICI